MAKEQRSIFNAEAEKKLRSPDDLDKYVRVTNPSAWAVIAACVSLLVGLVAWAVYGSVSTNVTTKAAYVDGRVVCFLSDDDVAKINVGDEATMDDKSLKVVSIGVVPISKSEALEVLHSDYLLSVLVTSKWSHQVQLGDDADGLDVAVGVPTDVTIITRYVSPISLVLGDHKE